MRCRKCGCERSSVVDSRGDADAIRRRRECQECGFRFTTFERIELSLPMIIKKDGRREPFDRQKLKGGLVRACEKRPVSMEEIDQTVDRIEKSVHECGEKEMSSAQVGDFLMQELMNLDEVAYVRFASVYREFSDPSQFVETLKNLAESAKERGGSKPAGSNPFDEVVN